MSTFRVKTAIFGLSCAIALAAAGAPAAKAAVLGSTTNVDFTGSAVTFGYGGTGFTFSDNGTSPFDGNPVSIKTTGSAEATALGAPFYSQPTPSTYFDPVRGDGVVVFDGTSGYSAFPVATSIPYSATAFFIGLEETSADGVHYGYGEFAGTDLVSYAFESVAGVGIQAGAPITGSLPVPEPTTFALLGSALLGLTFLRRKAH